MELKAQPAICGETILPNALVVDTNDEVIIQTGLVSDLGGILMPAFERGEE